MMPSIKDRTDDWRVQQRQQGIACRAIWAAVVLAAVNDAAHEVKKARKIGHQAREANAIARFRAWAKSRDGREVFHCAGINLDAAVVDRLVHYIESGQFSSYSLRGGRSKRDAA